MAQTLAQRDLNAFLQRLGEANDGANHGSEYALDDLPAADSLEEALGRYFSRLSTSNTPAQPAEAWAIRTTAIGDPDATLRRVARHWFFELEFSPAVEPTEAHNTVADFLKKLREVVGEAPMFEVHIRPPMWYECAWQDFAFDGGDRRWLLHLGYSD